MARRLKRKQPACPEVPSDLFSYKAKDKIFFTEDSDLRGNGHKLEQIFIMVSQRTGTKVTFILERTERDREGDVQYWQYCSHQPKEQAGYRAVVFND